MDLDLKTQFQIFFKKYNLIQGYTFDLTKESYKHILKQFYFKTLKRKKE